MIDNQPIYKDQGEEYHSDTCGSLIAAREAGKINMEAWARLSYPGQRLEEYVLPGVSTVGFWDAHSQQDWGLEWHRNEGIEITFLETGTMPFSLENGDYKLAHDDITITRPWQLHKVGNPNIEVGKLFWLILDVGVRHPHQEWSWPSWIVINQRDKDELTKMLRHNEQPIFKANAGIKHCFQKIGQVISRGNANIDESWLTIHINELLMHLLSIFRDSTFQLDETLTESVRTIELFIKDLDNTFAEPWTLESMAEHCGLGITRFVHYFKQVTNMTPMRYLIYMRLNIASNLLLNETSKNITQICYECGFSTSQYFATVFRKQFACTPVAYRINSLSALEKVLVSV
jgi:AraC-like DNA-binding protein